MDPLGVYNERRRNRWYFGGISAATAACITYPLDTIKVYLQTQVRTKTIATLNMREVVVKIYYRDGVLGFYNGLSASVMRQLTFTLVRLGIYDHYKYSIDEKNVTQHLALGFVAGFVGAIFGMPADVVKVRMQNDMRLLHKNRRNYKHVFDGLRRIMKEEGFASLFHGTTPNILRGIVQTISVNVVYDQAKYRLLESGHKDNVRTHAICSVIAASTGITFSQPVDIIKTRMMNAKPGEYTGMLAAFRNAAKKGPREFFKGFIPGKARIIPHSILFFIIMEQMRLYFGYLPPPKHKPNT